MWDGDEMDGCDPDTKDLRTARVPMRHGHRKRLDVPKRGKAALWAEIQGSWKGSVVHVFGSPPSGKVDSCMPHSYGLDQKKREMRDLVMQK